MSEEDISVPVLVDSKKVYTHILVKCLANPIYQGIQQIYDQARELTDEARRNDYLKTFQQLLRDVPKWNQEMIDTEYNRVILESKCNWLDNLIKAVFLSHVRILSAVRMGKGHKTIKLNIPKANNFIHKCYVEAARLFYQNPYLFSHKAKELDIHRNMNAAIELIKKAIHEAIHRLVPIQQILNEYLEDHQFGGGGDDGGIEDVSEDVSEQISPQEMQSVKEMVHAELKREEQENNETDKKDKKHVDLEDNEIEEELDEDLMDDEEEDEEEDLMDDDMESEPFGKQSNEREVVKSEESVKNIKVRTTRRKHVPETEVHHRVRPENVGNVDLGNFKKKINTDRLTFFDDASENL